MWYAIFEEVAPMAAHDMYGEEIPAAGVIAGIGRINGIECDQSVTMPR